ncbi:unnamed protein product [Caenorhabditis brenneri]
MSFAFGVAVGVAAAIIIKLADPECRQRSRKSEETVRDAIEKGNDQHKQTITNSAPQDSSKDTTSKNIEKVDEFQPRQYCILLKSE